MPEYDVIRAIDKASGESSQHLTRITTVVSDSREQLNQIRETLGNLIQRVLEGLNRIPRTQAQIAIITKISELESLNELISSQLDLISGKKEAFENDIKKLEDHYREIIDEVKNNFQNLLKNLDGHIIEINKKYFDNKTSISYSKKALPCLNATDKYYLDCSYTRSKIFKELVEKVKEKINKFLEDRKNFLNCKGQYLIENKIESSEDCSIPCFVLEINGNKKIIFPGKVYNSKFGVGIESLNIFKNFEQAVQNKENIFNNIDWYNIKMTDKDKMHKDLDMFFDKNVINFENNFLVKEELHKFIDNLDIKIGK